MLWDGSAIKASYLLWIKLVYHHGFMSLLSEVCLLSLLHIPFFIWYSNEFRVKFFCGLALRKFALTLTGVVLKSLSSFEFSAVKPSGTIGLIVPFTLTIKLFWLSSLAWSGSLCLFGWFLFFLLLLSKNFFLFLYFYYFFVSPLYWFRILVSVGSYRRLATRGCLSSSVSRRCGCDFWYF